MNLPLKKGGQITKKNMKNGAWSKEDNQLPVFFFASKVSIKSSNRILGA